AARLINVAGGLFPRVVAAVRAAALARLALAYGLDVLVGEEVLLYQGKPYLTVRGAMRIANRHPMFEGIECNPATAEERRNFRAGPAEHLWVARVWRRDRRFPVVGYGRGGTA